MSREPASFFQEVTDLVFVRDEPAAADVILIPGSSHAEPVKTAAALYGAGLSKFVLPSGRWGMALDRFRLDGWETEWDWMRDILLAQGVPAAAILREDQARCTWDNARLSRAACDAAGLNVRRALLCCRPFHARRAQIYYQWAFPEAEILCVPCREEGVNADDWHRTEAGRQRVLGELRRLGDQINVQLEELIAHAGE